LNNHLIKGGSTMNHSVPYGDTVVLAHGHTLEVVGLGERVPEFSHRDWEYIVIGDFRTGQMGRATTALWLALTHNSPKLIFGTGASCYCEDISRFMGRSEWEKAGRPDVEWESEYTLRLLMENFEQLNISFPLLNEVFKRKYGDWKSAQRRFFEIFEVDTVSTNTATEVREALAICNEARFITGIIRVTNRSHLPRCMNDAQSEQKTYKNGSTVF